MLLHGPSYYSSSHLQPAPVVPQKLIWAVNALLIYRQPVCRLVMGSGLCVDSFSKHQNAVNGRN